MDLVTSGRIDSALRLGKRDSKTDECRKLRSERFRTGDSDFRTGARWHHQIGLTRNGASRNIDQTNRSQACLAGMAHRHQRVQAFTRLGNGDGTAKGARNRLAITIFRSDFTGDGNAGQRLDPVSRHHGRVMTGAGRQHDNAVNRGKIVA